MNNYLDQTTFCITAFQRPKELNRLLKSIYLYFINPKILVVCDSKNQSKEREIAKNYPNCRFIFTEYDIGLSKKRNILLENCTTRFFLLLEEDYIFFDSEGLLTAYDLLISEKLDLVGGRVENIYSLDFIQILVAFKKIFMKFDFSRLKQILAKRRVPINVMGNFTEFGNELKLIWNSKPLDEVDNIQFDLYPNFFLAKKESLKKINGWQPDSIKIGAEHGLFFIRLYESKIKSRFLNSFVVIHKPKKRLSYLVLRMRKFKIDYSLYTNYENVS